MQFPLGVVEIEKLIPHRYPFLLVDRVVSCNSTEACAHKSVSIGDIFFQGHFPSYPVMPGVLLVEGLAQTAGILMRLQTSPPFSPPPSSLCFLTEVSKARFRRQVVPADVVRYTVRLLKQRQAFYWFAGEAHVEEELAASAELSLCVGTG